MSETPKMRIQNSTKSVLIHACHPVPKSILICACLPNTQCTKLKNTICTKSCGGDRLGERESEEGKAWDAERKKGLVCEKQGNMQIGSLRGREKETLNDIMNL